MLALAISPSVLRLGMQESLKFDYVRKMPGGGREVDLTGNREAMH